MRLKTLLKPMIASRYMIVGHYDSPYVGVELEINYFQPYATEMFQKLRELKAKNPTVSYVDYSRYYGCIEITIK